MASLAESSLGSVPIEEIRAAQQRLNNYKQSSHDTQDPTSEHVQQQHAHEGDEQSNATIRSESNSKGSTVPESIEQSTRVPFDSLPRTRKMLLNASKSAPREMLALIGDERVAIPKAMSFSQYEGGDTQPWDSQDVVESSKSMIRLGQTTPQKTRSASDSTPNTYNSGMDTDQSIPIVLGIDNMSPPTSQARRDFMGNDTQMHDLSRQDTSPTTSQLERGFLRDETQPRTQLGLKDVPATPAMAGNKHSREGELLTSASTVAKTPHNYTQLFGGGDKLPVMSNTQLFDITDSSPAILPPQTVVHSDPIQSRPSPNMNGSTTHSSPPFTSPIIHARPSISSSRAPGDPMTKYRLLAESQKDSAERAMRKQGDNTIQIDDPDESLDFRTIRGESKADGLSNYKTPFKRSPRPSSTNGVIELSDTVRTPITERQWNRFVEHAVGEDPAADEDDEQPLDETQDLPQVEFSERDEIPEPIDQDDNEQNDAEIEEGDGNDEYDEFGQTLRSQSNFEVQCEDDAVVNGSSEVLDREDPRLGDSRGEAMEEAMEVTHQSPESTQVSAIADSQPTAQQSEIRSASQQAVQYSPYIRGSQHRGKTSQELALLYVPQASNQSRVLASQLHAEENAETDVSGDKIPSSPPVARHGSGTIPEDSAEASIVRRDLLKRFQSDVDRGEDREVPESDTVEHLGSKVVAQQDDSVPLYSTARTHVSASAQSPAKLSLARTPLRSPGNRRRRSAEQSSFYKPFADFRSPSLVAEDSFDNALNQHVIAVADDIFGPDDPEMQKLMSDDTPDMPRTKRMKRSHPFRDLGRGISQEEEHMDAVPEQNRGVVAVQRSTISDTSGTTSSMAVGTVHPHHEEQDSSDPAFMDGEAAISAHEQRETPPPALKDSPNKANQMLAVLTDDEEDKARETTAESVRLREEAGRAAVSQLVASRAIVPSKRLKQTTYARGSRRRFSKAGSTAAGKLRKLRALATDAVDSGDDGHVMTEGEDDTAIAAVTHDTVATPAEDAISSTEQQPQAPQSSGDEEVADFATENVDALAVDAATDAMAGDRVWAFFRGTPHYFYTATWLGSSPDGMTYKIRFDDQTVTNIETYHVRRLELRIGDTVKVDEADKRKKNWVVVGFGPAATTDEERALGTDVFGHTHVKVQLKGNRESLSNSRSSNVDADEVHTVLVNYLYLTTTMWPHYKNRAFEPPTKAILARPETPSSGGASAAGTPASRSRRAPGPSAKSKTGRTSHLRETSVASSSSASPSAIFSGMAFAISYVSTGEEKKEITQLIQRNGGTILEDGFEELFDLPDIGTADVLSPSKKSPRKQAHNSKAAGLKLSAKYKDLKFAALIADRHSRRAKYMQALALGLPTLSGRWVVHSLDESKNPSSDNIVPLPWNKYLLPAGESTFLNAIRSRNLAPYDATSASLVTTVANRACLLNEEGLILVAPKTGTVNWEKRKTFAFLTMACGASQVKRVNDVQEAKKLTLDNPDMWKWVYVDTSVAEAEKILFGKGTSATGKKRKRASEVTGPANDGEKMSATDGVVKIVNDEFVIQSLILEALVE
ncbi:Putative DNA repair protein Crb2, Tudor [Septoria linicola]|uniref:DNA repair protein Crb2, Tudor n=1 Tax=Septoria linicola TaxID=215465 RepID=A0A9Q9EHW2_9PEZI|nr:putative DNA repair protein Crb2, Tudor [Septoria linicola]USW51390.1 Putative DNA repair protein Crb2, Tudor [Septoria linicola]